MTTAPLLAVKGLATSYGRIQALHGVDLEVRERQIVALLGANGAGKSTTLRTIVGLASAGGGTVELRGQRIESESVAKRIRRGIALVPESREVFPSLTVRENLRMGAFVRSRREALADDFAAVFELFPRLRERLGQLAGTLSGGEQQQVAVGRALMSRPSLLLLDEPSLGLAPLLLEDVYKAIVRLRDELGLTILLVEQNANMALSIADYAYVLESGSITDSGTPDMLGAEDRIRALYLGG